MGNRIAGRNIREVAALAGVSIATVSRVVNATGPVAGETRDRVLVAIEQLGYSRDGVARSLRLGKTATVGAVLSDFGNPVVSAIFRAATETLASAGYLTLVAQSVSSGARDVDVVDAMLERRVDGLLWSVSDEGDREVRSAVARSSVPIVLVERRMEVLGVDSVVADHYGAMVEAVEELVKVGHKCIGIIPGARGQWPRRERLRAFWDVLGGSRGRIVGVVGEFVGVSSVENGESAAREVLGHSPRPTAVIAGGNRVLVGAWRCIATMGLRVPEDVEFVAGTLADAELARVSGLGIAGIEVAADVVGAEAGRLLARRLAAEGPVHGESITVPSVYHRAQWAGVREGLASRL